VLKVQGHGWDPDYNHGYDEEDGSYKLMIHDHLQYRYEVLSIVAKGTTSQVQF
jgi:dual specificity tyrosine-phosphorylation-regulated kinase 2/3/4